MPYAAVIGIKLATDYILRNIGVINSTDFKVNECINLNVMLMPRM
jgi:hypothetical protein